MVPDERMARSIVVPRDRKVLLDADLAVLYGVETRVLVQAVKRNPDRFPADFTFRISAEELEGLRSQTVISKQRGGRRFPPHAFTEQGVAMLSSVLKSPRAIALNIEIMRVFVKLRQVITSHSQLARKLDDLTASPRRPRSTALQRMLPALRTPRGTTCVVAVAPSVLSSRPDESAEASGHLRGPDAGA